MNVVGLALLFASFIPFSLALLAKVGKRPVLGMTPSALLDVTRTCLLFSIAAALLRWGR